MTTHSSSGLSHSRNRSKSAKISKLWTLEAWFGINIALYLGLRADGRMLAKGHPCVWTIWKRCKSTIVKDWFPNPFSSQLEYMTSKRPSASIASSWTLIVVTVMTTYFVTLKTLRRRRARRPERPKEPARGMKFTQNTWKFVFAFVFVFLFAFYFYLHWYLYFYLYFYLYLHAW